MTTGSDVILQRMMALHPKIIDLTLDRVWRLLEKVGNPQDRLPPVIHVAGTNGKGSTQAMIRAGLEAEGKVVHAYTSPHLARFHERIRVAGELISEAALTEVLDRAYKANGSDPITYFEITTVAAIMAFAETPADYTLLEVGLGGRLDATNVIAKPALTIITPVDLDHQQYLGETLAQIAGEKAGIIKRAVPCVVGPQLDEGLEVIERVAARNGAPVYAYGDSRAGRSPQMIALSEAGTIGGGEGVDHGFQPDITLEDRAVLDHEGQELVALWTPGHFGNHMAFCWSEALFSGDHVMGWASTMISPPDGDLGAFRRSCTQLQERSEKLYLPGHGDAIEDGPARLHWLLAHRQEREKQIISQLQGQPNTAQGLAEAIYTDIDPRLIHAATRNVLAHLIDLCERKRATCHGPIDLQAKYSVI